MFHKECVWPFTIVNKQTSLPSNNVGCITKLEIEFKPVSEFANSAVQWSHPWHRISPFLRHFAECCLCPEAWASWSLEGGSRSIQASHLHPGAAPKVVTYGVLFLGTRRSFSEVPQHIFPHNTGWNFVKSPLWNQPQPGGGAQTQHDWNHSHLSRMRGGREWLVGKEWEVGSRPNQSSARGRQGGWNGEMTIDSMCSEAASSTRTHSLGQVLPPPEVMKS